MTLGPWRAGQPDTARLAALDNYPRSANQRTRLLWVLIAAGEHGATAHQAAPLARIPRPHTAHTRLAELAADGLVEMTSERRPTDTGSLAHVWRVTLTGIAAFRGAA